MDTQLIKNGKHSPGAVVRHRNGAQEKQQEGTRFEYRTITKEQARLLLGKMHVQRDLIPARVAGYQLDMNLGLWDRGAGRTPLAIDWNENTINGKNRLTAFLGSRLETITFLFALNCNPDDISTFDCDVAIRTKAQLNPDEEYVPRNHARVKAYYNLIHANQPIALTNSALQHLAMKQWRRQIAWAGETFQRSNGHCRSPYVAGFMYAYAAAPQFVVPLANGWMQGMDLPIQLLRVRDEALRKTLRSERSLIKNNVRSSLKVLNGLYVLHSKIQMPSRLSDSLAGLNYFSRILKDGTTKRWEDTAQVLGMED